MDIMGYIHSVLFLFFILGELDHIAAFKTGVAIVHLCQGDKFSASGCVHPRAVIKIKSVTVLTNSNVTLISQVSERRDNTTACQAAEECRRTINTAKDEGLTDEYRYLFQWIAHLCQGKRQCDETDATLPEWWDLTNTFKQCGNESEIQYFAGVLIHEECFADEDIIIPTAPPPTQPRQKPTTPAETTPYPVHVLIYQPALEDNEKIYLAVAIGLSLVLLIIILLTIYCCERYNKNNKNKQLRKQLSRLGAPQPQDNSYDEVDGWNMFSRNPDVLGEYSGVKPDEFVILDNHSHVYQDLEDTRSIKAANNNTASIERPQGVDNSVLHEWFPESMLPHQSTGERAEGDDGMASPNDSFTYYRQSQEDLSFH